VSFSRDVTIFGDGRTLAGIAQRPISAMVFEHDNEHRQIGARPGTACTALGLCSSPQDSSSSPRRATLAAARRRSRPRCWLRPQQVSGAEHPFARANWHLGQTVDHRASVTRFLGTVQGTGLPRPDGRRLDLHATYIVAAYAGSGR
jgi:hypothetical protein